MESSAVVARTWRRFRGLAGWLQLSLGAVAAMVVVAPFTSEAEQSPDRVTTVAEALAPAAEAQAERAGGPGSDDVIVLRVIDGDTIVVSGDVHVRLIGVDTPETTGQVQCFGPEATRYMTGLLPPGSGVRLAYDVERFDRYGRTLAYVHKLDDGTFVNVAVARDGFAVQLTVPPNVANAEEFRMAAAQARAADVGLWRGCQTTTTAAITPAPPAPPAPVMVAPTAPLAAVPTTRVTVPASAATTVAPVTTIPTPAGGCHPSYAGACVPSGFSDVDCAGGSGNGPGYVSTKNFRVVGPDVYRLDSDGDGIACESR